MTDIERMMADAFGDDIQVPPMRTFRVLLEGYPQERPAVFVEAHSVTCDGDAAKFFVYRQTTHQGEQVLAAYSNRTLRPYLDVQDVTVDVPVVTNGFLN
jgi:hypothetical protein